ncbi:MAG: SusC/RagA family TonB-linked outer membrane protein [Cyclobacteriaceae bacterium]
MKFILLTITQVTKFLLYGAICQCLFYTLALADSHAQHRKLETFYVSMEAANLTLGEVFDQLEKETEFNFTYLRTKVPLEERVTVALDGDLKSVLQNLADAHRLHIKRINDLIVVKQVKRQEKVEEFIILNEQEISGKITDAETGEPVIGATILVKGTTIGTISDINGEYTLSAPDDAEAITISFVGYQTQEITIGNQSIIDVSLSVDSEMLSEVLVIGYGSQSKAKVNGAVAGVEAEALQKYSSPNVDQQLAGRLAGVQINEVGGQPGYDAQIVIRGVGTLTADSYPLVVVDGVPLTEGSTLNSINPNDIEKIDVLKDAASAAIYGSRASNGVLLVTTKKGTSDKPTITIDAFTGWQMRADNVDYVDAYDAAQYFTEARDWGYVSKDPANRSETDDRDTRIANGASRRELRLHYLDPYLEGQPGLTNTDWLDEIFRTAPMTSITTSVSGAGEKSDYYVSGGYFNQDGIAVGTSFERYTAAIRVNTQLNKFLNFGINLNPSYSKQRDTDSGDWRGDPVAVSYTSYPFFSPYLPDGSLNISEQIRENTPEDGSLQENALGYANLIKDNKNRFRTFGSTFLTVKPLEGLEFKFLVGGDYRNYFYDFYDPSFLGQYRSLAPDQAEAVETNIRVTNVQSENTLTYYKDIGNHEFDFLAGYSFQREQGSDTRIVGTEIPDDNIDNIAGASSHNVDANRYTWTLLSYFGRLQYFYRSRYQLSLALRRDGSSRFGDETKWGLFPSVSAGWIISDETFFPQSNVINFAKLRVSWGRTGNNQIGSYGSQALVTADNYTFGGNLAPGFAATTSPNSALSWETNTSVNIGVDLTFLENFSLSANYYTTNTDGLLLEVPVPEQSGYSISLQNIGEVRNSGIELELGASGLQLGPVQWSVSANFASNQNEVLALGEGQEEIKISSNGGAWVTRIGGPIAEIFSYDVIGVYRTEQEIEDTPHLEGTLTGDYIVADINNDGVINEADQVSQGTYAPNFFYGFSSEFRYRNFDLSFAFNGIGGRTLYNWDQGIITETGEGFGMPTQRYFDNRYHPVNNPEGYFAQPNMGNFSSARRNTRAADIYMQDADYLRLRSLQLGYTFTPELISRFGLENLRLYVTANNLFTITEYEGFNPDASTDNILRAGYARDNFPIAKSFLIGANITLK